MSFQDSQKALEEKLGMNIWQIREHVISLPNDERWRYMDENQISGGVIMLAPDQYPKKPKEREQIDGEEYIIGRQMTIDDWLGTAPKDPADELIEIYITGAHYTLENMERKIDGEFKSYHGGSWARVSFDFSAGKAMFSKKIFSGYANRKKQEPGVYAFTKKEYTERVRRILTQ